MINPIGSTRTGEPAAQSTPPKPDHRAQDQQQTVKSGTVSRDQVTLKSAGQVDSDNK
jgi:hypothetical protein